MRKKEKNCSCEVVAGPRLMVWLPALVEGEGAGLTGGVSRPTSYDCVVLLNMLSILSEMTRTAGELA